MALLKAVEMDPLCVGVREENAKENPHCGSLCAGSKSTWSGASRHLGQLVYSAAKQMTAEIIYRLYALLAMHTT